MGFSHQLAGMGLAIEGSRCFEGTGSQGLVVFVGPEDESQGEDDGHHDEAGSKCFVCALVCHSNHLLDSMVLEM